MKTANHFMTFLPEKVPDAEAESIPEAAAKGAEEKL